MITTSAYVQNGRLDILATNRLGPGAVLSASAVFIYRVADGRLPTGSSPRGYGGSPGLKVDADRQCDAR